jgi:hypothetical protein
MDGCNLESDIRLQNNFSRMHQLLRDADGSAITGNGASSISRNCEKERRSTSVDGKGPSDRKGFGDPVVLAKTSEDICQLDV